MKRRERLKIIRAAKMLSENVKGIYAEKFETETEQSLYEIAVQAHASLSERKGVEKSVGKEILVLAIKLFPGASVGKIYISE